MWVQFLLEALNIGKKTFYYMNKEIIKTLYSQSIRSLIREANEMGVEGNKVITILSLNDQYVMVYYGE